MHELGIMIEIVKQVERVALANQVEHVEKIVLQIGEFSGVVPHFVRECFPAACYQSMLENCKLEIETIPANARCRACTQVYPFAETKGCCPACSAEDFELLSGREFILKEIVVSDEEADEADDAHESEQHSANH